LSKHTFSHKTVLNPQGLPTAAVVRYGAYGDLVQSMSVVNRLKKDGYHVTLICQYPGSDLVKHDPSIDRLVIQTPNQIPIHRLGEFWAWWEMRGAPDGIRYKKWINLTESVESNLLISPGNVKFNWAPKARHQFMDHNYLEFQHKIGDVPYEPSFKFYASPEELRWRDEELRRMKKAGIEKYVLWALAGSSRTHKIYPHMSSIWEHVMEHYPAWGVLTVGDPSCVDLEKGFEAQPRMWLTSTRYTIRQVFLMLETASVVVGPETGVMSAAAFYPMPKVIFLSHSTIENLSRDWVNTTSLWAPKTHCPGRGANEVSACHKMLPTFDGCRRNEETGVAQCATEIKPEWTWAVLQRCMIEGVAPAWQPPSE
jgi:ADP-heptose:LPS heptosyltransferase